MKVLQHYAILGALSIGATACSAHYVPPYNGSGVSSAEVLPPGLTCPVMTRVESDRGGYKTMLRASPENPMICLVQQMGGDTQSLILNWYAVNRLPSSEVDHAIEILSKILSSPVGFTTTWTRFLSYANGSYDTQFTVAPDQAIAIGGKNYDVRVIKAQNPRFEDNEYWFDQNSLAMLKYIDHNNPSRSYTVTSVVKAPAS